LHPHPQSIGRDDANVISRPDTGWRNVNADQAGWRRGRKVGHGLRAAVMLYFYLKQCGLDRCRPPQPPQQTGQPQDQFAFDRGFGIKTRGNGFKSRVILGISSGSMAVSAVKPWRECIA